MLGMSRDKDIDLHVLMSAFSLQLSGSATTLPGLELLHYMDRDFLRGLVDASNGGLKDSERARSPPLLSNVSEDAQYEPEKEHFQGTNRESSPYSPLWAHLDKRALPPVAMGHDSNSSDAVDFTSPFSMLLRHDSSESLPGDDDPVPHGLLKQGSDVSTMSNFFSDE